MEVSCAPSWKKRFDNHEERHNVGHKEMLTGIWKLIQGTWIIWSTSLFNVILENENA